MFARRIALRNRFIPAGVGSILSLAVAVSAIGQSAPSAAPAPAAAATSADAEAVEIFRSAAALQDRGMYDLAARQWAALADHSPTGPLAGQAHHFRGLCLSQLQRYDEAQTEFQRVIADWPGLDPELLEQSYVNLGLVQFNAGQAATGEVRTKAFDAAIATFAAQLDRFPGGTHAPEAWYYQAEARYAQGKPALATRSYQSLVNRYANHPLRAGALYGLGVAQQESGREADAAETFDQLLHEFPKSATTADAQLRYGEALVVLHRPAEAEPHFAAAAAADAFADADQALDRQASCRLEMGDYVAAARLYGDLTTRFADSPLVPSATVAAGKCYYLAGDDARAARHLRRALELTAETPDAHAEAAHWLALALLRDGQPAEAADVALRAASQNSLPAEWQARLRLDRADALHELPNRRAEAIGAYAAVARELPDDPLAPQAAYLAAYTALEIGDARAALALADEFHDALAGSGLAAEDRHVVAEAQLQLGQYDAAERGFASLRADFPSHEALSQWTVRHATCLSMRGQHDAVVDALKGQWSELSDPTDRAEAGLLLGRSLLAVGKPEDATRVLATAADLPPWPQSDEVLLTWGKAAHAAGDNTTAIAALDRLVDGFPASPLLDRAYYHRAQYHAAAGDDASAIRDFAQVAARRDDSPLIPHALLNEARLQYRRHELAPAQATLTRLLARFGHHSLAAQAYLTRATIRYDAANHDAAAADLTALLKTKPTRPVQSDAIYLRGLCEVKLDRPADAAASFRSILHDDPEYASADRVLYELALACEAAGQSKQAADAWIQLSRQCPDSPLAAEAYFRVGQSQYDAQQFAAAAASFAAACREATDAPLREKATHRLAWAQFSQQDFAAAEATFGQQLAQSPAGPLAADAAMMLAESRFSRDDHAAALDAYTKALAGPPARDDLRSLGLLHAGQAAAQLDHWDQSLALLDQCRREFPDFESTDQLRYERGWALYHLERYDDARQEFAAVAGTGVDELTARARFMIGETQFAQKQYDDAVRTFFQVAYGFGDTDAPAEIHKWQAEAMFEAARCLELTDRFDAARKLYTELLERFPDCSKAVHARNSLAALKTRRRN